MEFTGRKRKYDEIQTPKTETGDSSTPEEAIIDHTDPRLVDEAVCYGALHDVAAKPINKAKIRKELSSKATESSFSIFSIRSDKGCYLVSFKDGKDAAILDVETTSKLRALKSHPVRFDAVLQSNIFSKSHSDSGGSAKIIPLSINIFGPKRCAEDIASQLAKVSGFLQHPKMLNPGIEYYNPQYLAFPDETIDMNEFVDTGKDTARAQKVKISEEVEDILDSLAEFTYDTNFQRPAGLVTTLRRHQEHGISFILQREDKFFHSELSTKLSKVVAHKNHVPSKSFGGLIADVMGLGKTLTLLAAVLSSLPIAKAFNVDHGRFTTTKRFRSQATLVVVSSAQLLESWITEITTHFLPGSVNWILFHGPNRPKELDKFTRVDIVLTTYATLASDHSGKGLLHEIEWFRVVLDEAHWIRNSTSTQFRAAASLDARSRWCLTGTPIQNRLDDLTSLAQFLKLSPVPTRATFVKHILGPLSENNPDFSTPLRAYLQAYCLRRTATCLNLPRSVRQDLVLQFSPEEKERYSAVLDNTAQELDAAVSSSATIKKYNRLFTAILRMRILCNSGTLSPFQGSQPALSALGPQSAEVECTSCSTNDEDYLMVLTSFSFCPGCGRSLNMSSSYSDIDDTSMVLDEATQALNVNLSQSLRNGHSTKLSAVVNNISQCDYQDKHIVFSYWRSTLVLLSELLEQAGISYVRIDGQVSYTDRSKHLEAFRQNPEIHVLLMSIETGAVGLNLTIANHIHIVEPQWNPSVEEQAIGRALRMGQTREVKITRYLIEKTVEQNIVNLQLKKKRLATFTFDGGSDETVGGKLDDLKFVLNMDSS